MFRVSRIVRSNKVLNDFAGVASKGAAPPKVREVVDNVNNNLIENVLRKIPGGEKTKVFIGFGLCMGLLSVTFFGGKEKAAGHGAFDSERPEAVQAAMDKQEIARNSRFSQGK